MKTEGRKNARLLTAPRVHNLAGHMQSSGSRCEISEACKQMQLAENKIGGHDIHSVYCRATLSMRHPRIDFAAVKNIEECFAFLSNMCNVDTSVPAHVYMAIMSGTSPHATYMGESCLLGHIIDRYGYGCKVRLSSLMEMENANLHFEVVSWEDFARGLEQLREGASREWAATLEGMEAAAWRLIMSTQTVVRVSHFGSVSITMSWTKRAYGSLKWVRSSTTVVERMVDMIMRFVEICT